MTTQSYVPSRVTSLDLNDPVIRRFIETTRLYLRDYPELNRLTDGYDHSDRHIFWAILDTLSDWKSTPPFLNMSLNDIFDRGWFSIFMRGVVISLLESLGLLHMRNYLAYSDGGVNVQTENPQMIQSWLAMYKNTYEQKKSQMLIAQNIEWALSDGGGVHSDYLFINTFWGSW